MGEDIIDYIPQPKQKVFFTFDYDEVKIKHFLVISAFLSNFFVVKGKKILKITYYVLFFPGVFLICFSVDLAWIILKFVSINLFKIIKFLLVKTFEFAFDGIKYLFRVFFGKFIGKVLIIIGLAIGIMIVWDFLQNDYYDEFASKINEYLNILFDE